MVDASQIAPHLPEFWAEPSEEAEILGNHSIDGKDHFLRLVSSSTLADVLIAAIIAEKIFRGDVTAEIKDRWGKIALALRLGLVEDYEERDDNVNAGYQHGFAADMLNAQGKPDDALEHYLKSVELCREASEETGDRGERAKLIAHAGHQHSFAAYILKGQGKLDDALEHYLKSAELCKEASEETGDRGERAKLRAHVGYQHGFAADILREQGKPDESIKYYLSSTRLCEEASEETGDRGEKAKLRAHAGHQHSFAADILNAQGKPDDALEHHLKSAELCKEAAEETGDRGEKAKLIAHVGYQHSFAAYIWKEQGKPDDALEHYLKSAELCKEASEETGDRGEKAKLIAHVGHQHGFAADILREQGKPDDALEHHLKSAELLWGEGKKADAAYQFSRAAKVLEEQNKMDEALDQRLKSAVLFEEAAGGITDPEERVRLIKDAFYAYSIAGNIATRIIKEKPTGMSIDSLRATVDESYSKADKQLKALKNENLRGDEIDNLRGRLGRWEGKIWEPTVKAMEREGLLPRGKKIKQR